MALELSGDLREYRFYGDRFSVCRITEIDVDLEVDGSFMTFWEGGVVRFEPGPWIVAFRWIHLMNRPSFD